MGWGKTIVEKFRTPIPAAFQTHAPSVHLASAVYITPSTHLPPLNSGDKFLMLAGYLFAATVVLRVSPLGAVLMIAILVFLAWANSGTDDHT